MAEPDWRTHQGWRRAVERRLNEAMALAKGVGPAHADRISDVIDMIEELRKEVEALRCRMDKASAYIQERLPRKPENGGG